VAVSPGTDLSLRILEILEDFDVNALIAKDLEMIRRSRPRAHR
jgi:hypothetical protein